MWGVPFFVPIGTQSLPQCCFLAAMHDIHGNIYKEKVGFCREKPTFLHFGHGWKDIWTKTGRNGAEKRGKQGGSRVLELMPGVFSGGRALAILTKIAKK